MADEDISYRVKDLENQLSRLDQQMAKVDKLQDTIQSLETTKNVLIAVAVIFGLAGAWGANALQAAKSDIVALQAPIQKFKDTVKTEVDGAKFKIQNEAKLQTDTFDAHADSVLQNVITLDSNEKGSCSRMKDIQICWGKQVGNPMQDLSRRTFSFRFRQPFSEVPVVTEGIDADPLRGPFVYAVSQGNPQKETYDGNLEEVRGRPQDGTVRVSYVAVGKWK